ncbi:MAG: SDR family NAD(P)-dependent oxidoreductase [Actinomycetota bacterium]
MLLERKIAVVYGAGGRIGRAVARAFAGEGATVYLAGRDRSALDAAAEQITESGGAAVSVEVDALDEPAVDRFVDTVAADEGRVDVSFNAISHGDIHGVPLASISFDDFFRPVATAMRAQFLTARAAARHMIERGSGVIMAITANTARMSIRNVGGTAVSFDAIESLCRQWAAELGPHGVRVVWLHTTGIPEAIAQDLDFFPDYGTGGLMTRDELLVWLKGRTMLNRLTSLEDVGNMAAFAASDRARAVTATGLNLTCGSVPG